MLKAIIDTVDGLPDAVKEHYKQGDDGKFVLTVEAVNGFSLEDVTGLKNALGKERSTREALEKATAKFKDLDPDKAREALAKMAELSEIDPQKEADKLAQAKVDAIKAQLLESHGKDLKTRDDTLSAYRTQIEKLLIDSAATSALADAKGSIDLLLPHIRNAARVVEKDGAFAVEIVKPDGSPKVNGKGDNMSITELVAEMRQSDVFGRAFEASGHSGTGKGPSNGTGGTGQLKRSQMTNKQKADYIAEHGQEAFLKLPK
ncbi:Phage protein [Hyphomicrobium sulfonivorans]|uniref:Phage protein n=1 Tax=Hyphomicrobium sulfonivorans TaxID=121290 RepID=A0A109BLJ7_HYPSL|nr:hypothetical protein [Hyphomicrobium sulfonivorans]KWT70760.1 Phage protein [Hyphomicrobium sulfonivorans]